MTKDEMYIRLRNMAPQDRDALFRALDDMTAGDTVKQMGREFDIRGLLLLGYFAGIDAAKAKA